MGVRVSHVGSFPLDYSINNVDRVSRDLIEIGVEVPPYPQLRSFIEIYLDPLVKAGVIEYNGGYYLAKRGLSDKIDLSSIEASLPEAEHSIKIYSEAGVEWVRGPVTGPLTLASRIYTGDPRLGVSSTLLVSNREFTLNALVDYVKLFAKKLSSMGYNIVFIDEPILSFIVGRRRILYGYTEDELRNIYSRIASCVRGEVGIHVCGRISSNLFRILASTEGLRYINIELHDTPENMNVIDPKLLENYDKKLAPGVASSKKPSVESEDEVESILKKAVEKTNGRVDLVSADCGFSGLKGVVSSEEGYRIGIEKLKVIKKVASKINL